MRKHLLFYIVSFALFVIILLYFNKAYREITEYSEFSARNSTVLSGFQNLSKLVNNAAVLNPELNRSLNVASDKVLFFADSTTIIKQLESLLAAVRDSINIKVAEDLNIVIRTELSWLLVSNVPDSIIGNRAPEHITSFKTINSLILKGIERTGHLIEYRKSKFNKEINKVKLWMTIFIFATGFLLFYTSINILKQRSQRKKKEKELETVLNRISDGVVSLDNDWRYTFLNDAAVATHPSGKKETLGKVIWDIHPEMKGTIFWDKYHEAMLKKSVVEIESYYSPMDIWFSVKVYPSDDGLTIFYKNVTEAKKAEQQLSQTVKEVEDYKFALDEASIVATTDQKGIITHANENFCKISKYSLAELIGQDHRMINSGYHPREFIKNLWVTIANGRIWKGELKNKAKDGTIYWVDTTIVPFLDDKGKPYQYIAIRADITERKQAEDDLVSSEKRFRSLIENSAEGIALTDESSTVIYRSPAAEKITGVLPFGKTIGRTHPDDMEAIQLKRDEVMRRPGVPVPFQGRFLHAAGHYFWLEGTFTNLLHVKEVKAIVANYRDITLRKDAEDKLIKSEKIYKAIASNIPDSVICLLDRDYRYFLIEGDMLEKLGYSKDKLLGEKAADVLAPEIFASVQKEFESVLNGETITRESSTSGYDVISRFIPLRDENDFVYAIMTVAIDVTKLKSAQRDISKLNRDLEEKIKKRTEQLRKSNEELEAFSYSVSHDLRAPLRGIIAFTKILEEEYSSKLDDEARRITSIIRDSTLKMGNLIDDLLAFSRMGKLGITKVQVNTNVMVREIINEQEQANKQPNAVNWSIHDLPFVHADTSTLRQVWINLISNAIKYSGNRERPQVEIGSYPDKGQVVFYIRDNGAGFDEEYKDKLFKVFQRLHDADEFEGTGIGLALVEKIISRHDGKVWAEGKEDEGACFYFSIP